jgi:hypothetical protein
MENIGRKHGWKNWTDERNIIKTNVAVVMEKVTSTFILDDNSKSVKEQIKHCE